MSTCVDGVKCEVIESPGFELVQLFHGLGSKRGARPLRGGNRVLLGHFFGHRQLVKPTERGKKKKVTMK